MFNLPNLARSAVAAGSALALCTSLALAQSDVSITLNGTPLNLNPAPQERAGRVFVPLRGVFEQLGASVVYDNGTINAQKGRDRSVSLRVGSTQATVNGQPQTIDVAPFIIGASTYVPLRFVSQALGATVNYDAANRIVALGENGPPPRGTMQAPPPDQRAMQAPPPAPPQRSPLVLADVQPGRDQAVEARRPTIKADFRDAQANPNSIRIQLDGVDVTDQSSRSPRGVVFSPPSDLQAGRHEVRVAGTDLSGRPFESRWTFFASEQRAVQPPPPAPAQRSPLVLANVRPGRDQAVGARRPTIEADFGNAQANPNSVRIQLDGVDVTDQSSRSPRGVVFSPPSDLQAGRHEVRIAGADLNGMPFESRWTFESGTSTVSNVINDLRPGNGAAVPDRFTVSGRTLPGARVVVQVGTVNQPTAENVVGQLLGVGNGSTSVRSEVIADGSGNFAAPIDIHARPGQPLSLVVDSTDAQSKAAAPRVVRNLTAE